ncbi:unnamed protein product, partial [Prorocentrum cordatum]
GWGLGVRRSRRPARWPFLETPSPAVSMRVSPIRRPALPLPARPRARASPPPLGRSLAVAARRRARLKRRDVACTPHASEPLAQGMKMAVAFVLSAMALAPWARAQGPTPVQKVIELMEGMLAKGKEDKKAEQVGYAAFKQFCEDTETETSRNIEEAEMKIETLKADIEKFKAEAARLKEEADLLDGDIAAWTGDEAAATKFDWRRADKPLKSGAC